MSRDVYFGGPYMTITANGVSCAGYGSSIELCVKAITEDLDETWTDDCGEEWTGHQLIALLKDHYGPEVDEALAGVTPAKSSK